jgi:hypothetical protein
MENLAKEATSKANKLCRASKAPSRADEVRVLEHIAKKAISKADEARAMQHRASEAISGIHEARTAQRWEAMTPQEQQQEIRRRNEVVFETAHRDYEARVQADTDAARTGRGTMGAEQSIQ